MWRVGRNRRRRGVLCMSRLCWLALVGGVLLIAPAAARAQAAVPSDQAPAETATPPAAPAEPVTPPVVIDGFRSAHFGMAEAEVRKAITADFKLSGTAVRT